MSLRSPEFYVITGGKLEVKDKSWLVGEYVTFVFDDDAAVFNFDKDTRIDLVASRDGPMAGMLFFEESERGEGPGLQYQKRECPRQLLGTIYLPNGRLKIDFRGNMAELSAYTVIVASQVHVKGANLVVNWDYGGTDVPVPEGIGPNSTMVMLNK